MSVTDELRRLLDERCVKYDEITKGNTTLFRFDYCDSCDDYMHSIAITGACISAYSDYLTPEQAIAATLGNELNPDGLPVGLTILEDGELLNWRGENYVRQRGECEMTETEIEDTCGEHYVYLTEWTCSECGYASTSLYSDERPKFCKECGAKVKAVKR